VRFNLSSTRVRQVHLPIRLSNLMGTLLFASVWLICKTSLWLQIDSMRFAGINP
jgi:hypothetical protein